MTEKDPRIERRVIAAIYDTNISRSAVEYDWPECHRKKCEYPHPDPSHALTTMLIQVSQQVRGELQHRGTTQPDVAEDGDSPELIAQTTLAVLLGRYTSGTTGGAGTFMGAAQLLIDAYPGMVDALNNPTTEDRA